MSNRRNAFTNENPNPAELFIQWKSDHQKFSYWDKEKEANIFIELPFKFLTLDVLQTVKGYNPKRKSGIYSNEVKKISSEKLTVRYFDEKELIAEGLWNEIKDDVDMYKGHYALSIYIMLEDGRMANLSLKGAGVGQWFEFTKKTKQRLYDEWISVNGFKDGKQGSVEFTYPVFEFSGSLAEDDAVNADGVFDTLEMYLKSYLAANEISQEKTTSENTTDSNEDNWPTIGELYGDEQGYSPF
jgi:hypothetical protein